jgi:hypothetical protein
VGLSPPYYRAFLVNRPFSSGVASRSTPEVPRRGTKGTAPPKRRGQPAATRCWAARSMAMASEWTDWIYYWPNTSSPSIISRVWL